MANYSITDTILVWSENKEIVQFSKEIAKELGLKLFKPTKITDLMAVPCFLKIIDSIHLKELLTELDKEKEEYFSFNETKIIVNGKYKFTLPYPARELVLEAPYVISKKYLFNIIKENLESALREEEFRNNQYKKRSWRAIYLYHLIISGETLNIQKITNKFDLTGNEDKTIKRGLELLMEIDPKLNIFYYNKEEETMLRTTRKKRVVKILNTKQTQFKKSVARIIDLYQMIKNGELINVKKYCNQYKVGEKTLARDIKIIREVNPERKINYDASKGYF